MKNDYVFSNEQPETGLNRKIDFIKAYSIALQIKKINGIPFIWILN